MIKPDIIAAVWFCMAPTASPTTTVPTADPGRLIVFVSPDASPLARAFQREHLPAIQKTAETMGVSVTVIDVSGGAPGEIGITPLIVYQNWRGRSIYQGRYTRLDRIRNFIRTSRAQPQGEASLTRTGIPVWTHGRARVAAPIKIAPVAVASHAEFNPVRFEKEAMAAVRSAFTKLRLADRVTLKRCDRLFYMDFYPWLSADGRLFLSVALYSQFHCKKPVFTQSGDLLKGPWKDRRELFRKGAVTLERAMFDQLQRSTFGDGFDPVGDEVPVVSWESLGLGLPPRPEHRSNARLDDAPPLSDEWRLEPPLPDASPVLGFRFPAPLDSFSGEVTGVTGRIKLGPNRSLPDTHGWIEADPRSVTMGEPDLDDALQSEVFLDVDHHPRARFEWQSMKLDDPARSRLAYGESIRTTLMGRFTLKGVTIPLSVPTLLEPMVGADGRPRLMVRGGFDIRLAPFHIVGPDGPSPAKDTLEFSFELSFKPAGPARP